MPVTTTDRFGRTRDQQKERVYRSEDSIRTLRSPKAARMLDTEARLIPQRGVGCLPGGKSPSIEDCQRYVDDVLRDPWVQRRWGQQTVTVHWKASGSATCSYGGTIALPPWSRIEPVILHELAHHFNGLAEAASSGKPAHHGPEFAGILLSLVRHRMGAEAGQRLRAAMREKRARVSMAHVPAPTRTVVTAAARAERAAEREQRLTMLTHRRKAAEVVRRLANRPAPLFGPAGAKPRTYALATRRALVGDDKVQAWLPANLTDVEVAAAAATIRACVKADLLGKVGSKPRARALAVARTLEQEAPKYAPDGRRMVYAAKPAAW